MADYNPINALFLPFKGVQNRILEVSPDLVAKFHSESKHLKEGHFRNLDAAVRIARNAVKESVRILDHMTGTWSKVFSKSEPSGTSSKSPVQSVFQVSEEVLKFAFRTHMKLDLSGFISAGDTKDCSFWLSDLKFLKENFRQIRKHLSTRVTIADSYSPIFNLSDSDKMNPLIQEEVNLLKNGTTRGTTKLRWPVRARFANTPEGKEKVRKAEYRFFTPDDWGSIHVNFYNLPFVPPLRIAITIIHETSHKMANTGDFGYADGLDKRYEMLSKNESLLNADSYAYLAISLYKKTAIKNEDDLGV
jgi:hypothetical protein